MESHTKDLLWVVLSFVVLGILWAVTGGKADFLHRAINPLVTSRNGPVKEADNNPFKVRSTISPGNSLGSSSGGSLNKATSTPKGVNTYLTDPAYAGIKNKSPYFKEITLHTGNINVSSADQEYLVLNAL